MDKKIVLNFVFSPTKHMINKPDVDSQITQQDDKNLIDGRHLSVDLSTPRSSKQKQPAQHFSNEHSYIGLSIIVAFFINLPLGLVALCFSYFAQKSLKRGDVLTGKMCAKLSLCSNLLALCMTALCVVGLILMVIYTNDRQG